MSNPDPNHQTDPIGRVLGVLCAGFALAGGGLLLAMVLATLASVLGRGLVASPVPGDFELVEIGTAVAVFAFLPYGQWRRGHVIVDVFTRRAASRVRAWLDAGGALLFAVVAALLAWRLARGGLDLARDGSETMVLGLPLWVAFPPIAAATLLLVAVCLHGAWRSLDDARR